MKIPESKKRANQKYINQLTRQVFSLHNERDRDLIEKINAFKAESKGTDMSLSKLVVMLLKEHFDASQQK